MPAPGVERSTASSNRDESYDAAVSAALPTLSAGVAGLFALLAVLHVFLLEGVARTVMAPAAAGMALLLAGVAYALHRRPVRAPLAQPLTAGLVLLVAANSVALLVLLDEPRQTTNVMLVLVGTGAVLLSLRWLFATLYLIWGGWAVGAFLVSPSPQWPHYVVGLASATVIAVGINHLRRTNVRQLAESRAAAEAAAVRDHLTGVANRRGLALVGAQMVEQARRQGDAVHCIFVDIDELKRVNDALGHAAGDDVIVAVAEALRSVTRATDVVARWGGDEFCVVGPGPGMPPLELERRVRDNIVLHQPLPEELWPVQVSAGGSMLAPWDAGTLETLLGKADQEMYLRRNLRKERPAPSRRAAAAE